MKLARITLILSIVLWLALFGIFLYLLFLLIKALRKYLNSKDVREEKNQMRFFHVYSF